MPLLQSALPLLCLDPDPETQAFVSKILGQVGFQLQFFSTPLEALSGLMHFKPVMILAEVNLPDFDGYTFGRMLRSHADLADVPLIFWAKDAAAHEPLRLFQAGGVEFLHKPFSARELVAVLKRHLRKAASVSEFEPADKKNLQQLHPHHSLTLAEFKHWLVEKLQLSPYVSKAIEPLGLNQMMILLEQRGYPQNLSLKLLGEAMGWTVIEEVDPNWLHLEYFPLSFIEANRVLPLQESPDKPLCLAICNPFNLELLDLLQRYPGSQRALITPYQFESLLGYYGPQKRSPEVATVPAPEALPLIDLSDLQKEMADIYQAAPPPAEILPAEAYDQDDPFIIRLLNRIIDNACLMEASDIHIQPEEHQILVRYRVDGDLRLMHQLTPVRILLPLVSRLKIMSGLNIAEHRLPQDGRIGNFRYSAQQFAVDLRVSIVPSQFGESVVLRILYKSRSKISLDHFGFSPQILERYRQGLQNPYGIILNVGPTGSGKTTTLYAALHELNAPERKIITIEDPVEYTLSGVLQVETQPEIGMTFQRALKAFLRHDPDIILLGEIRDLETARTAIEASLTGHLVLSTMHTNDAAGTITRFMEMGLPPFMISASLMMICAQRLLRRLCPRCREPFEATSLQKYQLQQDIQQPLQLYRARGCDDCGMTGYHGRLGIHEVLQPNESMRVALAQAECTAESIRNLAVKQCQMVPLYQDAQAKVLAGLTTLEELNAHVLNSEKVV